MEEKESKKEKERFEAVEIPTQHVPAIRDNLNDTLLQDAEILTEILNKIDRIERAVG